MAQWLTMAMAGCFLMATAIGPSAAESTYPELPEGIASFGAAVDDHTLYVYGGHKGTPHDHSRDNLSTRFARLDLRSPTRWEELELPRPLQGLPIVCDDGRIVRIGGMEARNAHGASEDLHSVADVGIFDPKTNKWSAGPALPTPRSSHDAIVLDGMIYVVGGWTLDSPNEPVWRKEALRIDLDADTPTWTSFEQPFYRRALSLATRGKLLYAIGGMNEDAKPTTSVQVYDPATNAWRAGPSLPGEERNGFGAGACECDGELYASTMDGKIWKLNPTGDAWTEVAKAKVGRFFHRMASTDDVILLVGGASKKGHQRGIERIELPKSPAKVAPAAND